MSPARTSHTPVSFTVRVSVDSAKLCNKARKESERIAKMYIRIGCKAKISQRYRNRRNDGCRYYVSVNC